MLLVKNKEQEKEDGSTSDSELVGLIEQFHNQYQSLCTQYSNLRGESGRRSRGRKETKAAVSSISSSDSEYYSSEDTEINNRKLRNGQEKMPNVLKKECKTESSEVNEIKQELVCAIDENGASQSSENLEALSKTQTSDKDLEGQVPGLKLELEALHSQKIDLELQCANKTTEAKQLEKENKGLQEQTSKLELISKESKKR